MNQLSVILSLVAGISSFVSPCVFPLIPSYLSVIGGNLAGEDGNAGSRSALLWRTVSFVLGFSVVFVVLGVLFSAFGLLLGSIANIINVVSAIIILLLAVQLLFNVRSFLQYEKKLFRTRAVRGNIGAFFMGVAFSAGWSPCIGPVLTSILLLAANSNSVGIGAFYLLVYSIGLGIPFLLIGNAVPYSAVQRLFRDHGKKIKTVSGVILLIMGLLILFGRLQYLNSWLVRSGLLLEGWTIAYPLTSKVVSLCIVAIAALTPSAIRVVRLLRGGMAQTEQHTQPPSTQSPSVQPLSAHPLSVRPTSAPPSSVRPLSVRPLSVHPSTATTQAPPAVSSVQSTSAPPSSVQSANTQSSTTRPLSAALLKLTLRQIVGRNIVGVVYLALMVALWVLVALERINVLSLIGKWLQFQGL